MARININIGYNSLVIYVFTSIPYFSYNSQGNNITSSTKIESQNSYESIA